MTNSYTTIRTAFCIALAVLSLGGCRKDDDGKVPVKPPEPTALRYIPGYPDSYWIYESYYVDSNGAGSPGSALGGPSYTDSFYQATDTAIAGHTFKRLMKPVEPGDKRYAPFYYRDSAGYLIGLDGRIVFSSTDTNRIFETRTHPGAGTITSDSTILISRYAGAPRTVRALARDIPTLAAVTEWRFYPFAKDAKPVERRRQYMRLAQGIGIVYETLPFYTGDAGYVERRLVRARVIFPIP